MPIKSVLACAMAVATLIFFSRAANPASSPTPVRLAITIDDLPWVGELPASESASQALQRITAVLRVHEAPATGFVVCDHARKDEQSIRSWVSWGFRLGNHSAAHRDLNRTPVEEWLGDVTRCRDYLRTFGEASTPYFRFPMLHQGKDRKTRSAVSTALAELGLETAHVSVDTSEWILALAYSRAITAEDGAARHTVGRAFVDHVVAAIDHADSVARRKLGRPASQILLVHANMLVADYLDELLLTLRSRGIEFITLSEALADPVYARRDDYIGPKGLSWLYRMEPASPADAAWDDAQAKSIRLRFPRLFRSADSDGEHAQRSQIVSRYIARNAPKELENVIEQASLSERMHSLLIMHRDHLIAEGYFNGAGPDTPANLKSITKTLVSALVGVALKKGWIGSIDDPIARYLPFWFADGRHPEQAKITLRQLLTMSSGLASVDYGTVQQSTDWIGTILAQPVEQADSSAFKYDTPVLQLLSVVLEHASGRAVRDLANHDLLGPIGGEIVYWREDSQGIELGGNDAYMRPRDLIQLGELYRNDGTYNGRQILRPSFVRASTSFQIQPREATVNHGTLAVRGYGFLWWLLEIEGEKAYGALGHGGQILMVFPRRELVVVMTSRWPSVSSTEHYRHMTELLHAGILPLFPRSREALPDPAPSTVEAQ